MNFYTPRMFSDLPDQRELIDCQRQLIVPNSEEILGGVFSSRVGVVVDNEENPGPYDAVVEAVSRKSERQSKYYLEELTLIDILEYVKSVVKKATPYSPSRYNSLVEKRWGLKGGASAPDEPEFMVGLSDLLIQGANTCQNYALLAGATIRLLQRQEERCGGINPDFAVSIENGRPWTNHTDRHVYTTLNTGELTYTIDPTHPFVTQDSARVRA